MSLRLKILSVFLSVILLIVTVLIGAGYAAQNLIDERYAASTLHGRSLVWRAVVSDVIDGLNTTLTRMTRDRALKDALAKGDKTEVAAQIGPIYSMLAAQGAVDRVAAFDAQGRYLVMQGGEGLPQRVNAAVALAMEQGKVASGLVLSDDGLPMAAVATPLSKRGQPIGGGVLMRSLEWAVKQFTRRAEAEAGLYLNGRLQWQSEGFLASLVSDPGSLPDYSVMDQSGRTFVVTRHRVEDVTGAAIADLLVMRDHSESFQKQRLQSRIALVVTLVVIGVGLLLSYLLLTRMLLPLGTLGQALKRISAGDLGVEIQRRGSSEILDLQDSAGQMVEHLRELLQQIHEATDLVAERAQAMTGSAHNSLSSVGSQREQMQHLMDSVERMENSSSQVERRAVEASARTQEIDGEVEASRQVVEFSSKNINNLANQIGQSAEVVRRVRDHSDRIRAFLNIIQDVAEQTNLLALNAAIESARAGEMGRGFAVVAEEVRNLSHRTTQNTREIQNVIEELHRISEAACESMEESVRIAHESVGTSQQTNQSLVKIVQSVEEIRAMSSAIVSMASEQHQMSGGMSHYVVAVNSATQEAEDQANEIVQSCDRLVEVANNLRTLVGRFQF